jgi:hypothetical protein
LKIVPATSFIEFYNKHSIMALVAPEQIIDALSEIVEFRREVLVTIAISLAAV